MKIIDRSVYVGPSLYAHFPVIRLDVDLGPLEEWPTGLLGPPIIDGLLAALPGLGEHGCSYGEPGGFIRRMREDGGTWLGHVLEHVAIELQQAAGEKVTFGKTRSADVRGQYHVVFQYEQSDVGLEAGNLALTVCYPKSSSRLGVCPKNFTCGPSWSRSSSLPSGETWAPAPRRWSMPPRNAASRGFG